MFSYDEFKSFVKSDGMAKQNRFYIDIAVPSLRGDSSALFQGSGSPIRDLHLLCKSVSVPGINVATTQQRNTGEAFEVPYDRNFGPATFQFYVDRRFLVKAFFDDWIGTIQNNETREFGWYNDFVARTISVFVLDKMDRVNYELVMLNAFPKNLGALSVDQENAGIYVLDVTMDFQYYRTVVHDSTPTGQQPQPALEGLLTDYTNLATYNNDFLGYQNAINTGLNIFNNTGIDINQVFRGAGSITTVGGLMTPTGALSVLGGKLGGKFL